MCPRILLQIAAFIMLSQRPKRDFPGYLQLVSKMCPVMKAIVRKEADEVPGRVLADTRLPKPESIS